MSKRGVYAIICNRNTGDVLLARRSAKVNNAGLWNFPGGRRDGKEGIVTALRRELKEELGWEFTQAEVAFWRWVRHEKLPDDQSRVYVLIYVDEVRKIKLNKEHSKALWIRPALLKLFRSNPPTRFFLSNIPITEVIRHGQ